MKMFHIIGYIPSNEWVDPDEITGIYSYPCSEEVQTLHDAERLAQLEAWASEVAWDGRNPEDRDKLIAEWESERDEEGKGTWVTMYRFATSGALVWQ